jgi:Domain of unknown function (DUF4397)
MIIGRTRGAHARQRSLLGTVRAAAIAAAVAALTLLPLAAPTAALATATPALDGTGTVTLVHAVPGLIADVSVDGKVVLTGFTASRVTDPVTLSAGEHTVTLKADNGPDAGKVVLTATLNVIAGTTSTAVVGLTPNGTPKAYVFPEMPIAVPNGQAAVVVRHVAATGPIKLMVDGAALPGTLSNGATETTDAAPGTHHVVVQSAAGTTILAAQSAPLQADRVTTLYLTGSQQASTLTWVATNRLASSLTSLSAIPTGDGSTDQILMTSRTAVPTGTAALISVAMGAAAFVLTRRRTRPRANA